MLANQTQDEYKERLYQYFIAIPSVEQPQKTRTTFCRYLSNIMESIKEFDADVNCRRILAVLKYAVEVRGLTVTGIGIVPHVYAEAADYWKQKRELRASIRSQLNKPTIEPVVIHRAVPLVTLAEKFYDEEVLFK